MERLILLVFLILMPACEVHAKQKQILKSEQETKVSLVFRGILIPNIERSVWEDEKIVIKDKLGSFWKSAYKFRRSGTFTVNIVQPDGTLNPVLQLKVERRCFLWLGGKWRLKK